MIGLASAKVDEARLWRRHMDMAKLGATPKGGVRRLALDANDAKARALLLDWGRRRGFSAFIDPIANFFIRRDGTDRHADPVLSGSHTDTQPSGGRFDGIYGVLAAFEALEAIEDAGIRTRRPIELAVWTCEEGGAYLTGTMGSSVFVGARKLDDVLRLKGTDDAPITAAIAATRRAVSEAADRPLGFPISAFVEAHIEQGPELEAVGKTIGVVTVIQGCRRFFVEVDGEDGHAGTVKRSRRRDAFVSACDIAHALRRHFHDPDEIIRFTIGRFVVTPNAPAVIPGHVTFSIDFRHPDDGVLRRLGDAVADVCRAHQGACTASVREAVWAKPVELCGAIPDLIEATAGRLGLSHMRMLSGAGHDAMYIAQVAPVGMIFVPCEKGISHNEVENATPADLAAGARVLAEVLVELADRT
jgi:N-carbamoyl-L-amino-acid hydrolase